MTPPRAQLTEATETRVPVRTTTGSLAIATLIETRYEEPSSVTVTVDSGLHGGKSPSTSLILLHSPGVIVNGDTVGMSHFLLLCTSSVNSFTPAGACVHSMSALGECVGG